MIFFRRPEIFRGEDSVEQFLDAVIVATNEIRKTLKKEIPVKRLTQQQEEDFYNAEKCRICEQLLKANEKRVKDHDHLIGEY